MNRIEKYIGMCACVIMSQLHWMQKDYFWYWAWFIAGGYLLYLRLTDGGDV